MPYIFNTDWFQNSMLRNDIRNNKKRYNNPTYNILEIGCYEGGSSCFFSDNLLDGEDSTLDCVDPFLNDVDNDHKSMLLNDEELRFDSNIKLSLNFNKITTHKITSDEFFTTNKKVFNLIFIDGCHSLDCVKRDLINSYECLVVNGIIWMDDYGGGTPEANFRSFVDEFIIEKKCEIIEKGYQIAFIKK